MEKAFESIYDTTEDLRLTPSSNKILSKIIVKE